MEYKHLTPTERESIIDLSTNYAENYTQIKEKRSPNFLRLFLYREEKIRNLLIYRLICSI